MIELEIMFCFLKLEFLNGSRIILINNKRLLVAKIAQVLKHYKKIVTMIKIQNLFMLSGLACHW